MREHLNFRPAGKIRSEAVRSECSSPSPVCGSSDRVCKLVK